MGIILSRFRKKKTTLEQLEKLDSDINSIERFRLNTELAQRKIVGQFILISAAIYIIVAVVFYFYFFPATFYDQLFYITPLLLVPFIIWGVKRLLTWYYRRKISRNENKLSTLRTEKKKVLEQVMETETYKVAKTILEKFAPDQLRKSPTSYEMTQLKLSTPIPTPNIARSKNVLPPRTNLLSKTPANYRALQSIEGVQTPFRSGLNTNGRQSNVGATLALTPGPGVTALAPRTPLPMPREILPRDRSVLDKMVEYLVGDGPSNRYALICKNCYSHNGMALKEEFEYVAFRCCYCFTMNPARKLKPQAPKLEFDLRPEVQRDSEHSTSSSEKNSGSDTESDEKNPDRSRKNSEASDIVKVSKTDVEPEKEKTPEEPEALPEEPEKSEIEKKID